MMVRRRIALMAAAVALAACGPRAGEEADAPPVIGAPIDSTAPVTPPAEPRAETSGPLPRQLPPPSETTPRFVGLWAVNQNLCAEPAWRFEADEVSTRGEVHCDFERILPTPGGYSVQASCTAEAPPAPYEIEFTFAESARAMMILGGPWGHASLVYCGPLTRD